MASAPSSTSALTFDLPAPVYLSDGTLDLDLGQSATTSPLAAGGSLSAPAGDSRRGNGDCGTVFLPGGRQISSGGGGLLDRMAEEEAAQEATTAQIRAELKAAADAELQMKAEAEAVRMCSRKRGGRGKRSAAVAASSEPGWPASTVCLHIIGN